MRCGLARRRTGGADHACGQKWLTMGRCTKETQRRRATYRRLGGSRPRSRRAANTCLQRRGSYSTPRPRWSHRRLPGRHGHPGIGRKRIWSCRFPWTCRSPHANNWQRWSLLSVTTMERCRRSRQRTRCRTGSWQRHGHWGIVWERRTRIAMVWRSVPRFENTKVPPWVTNSVTW